MQIVMGLICFAGGLKDKAFQILHMFGISCMQRFIRTIADKWSVKYNVLNDVNVKAFFQFSFDNLNFHCKFAKVYQTADKVTGRMLNLLTGQIYHRVKGGDQSAPSCDVPPNNPTK